MTLRVDPADGLGRLADTLHGLTGERFRVSLVGASDSPLHDSLTGVAALRRGADDDGGALPPGREDVAGETVRRLRLGTEEVTWGLLEVPADLSEERVGPLRDVLERAAAAEYRAAGLERELEERREEIALLTSISDILGSVIEPEQAARTILREVVSVTQASRATLWLYEPSSERLVLIASSGQTDPAVRSVATSDADSLVARVFRRQEPLLVGPSGEGLADGARSAWAGYSGSALLAVPVTYTPPGGRRRRVGVLGLVGKVDGRFFTPGDRKLMAAIASQVGAAVENGRLVLETLRRERLSAELGLAHDLQLLLLPDPASVSDLFPVAARCEPAESVGGDFYQLVRRPGERLGVMVGDVSSHGIGAALLMAHATSAVAILAREEESPARVLDRLEAELGSDLVSAEMFVTTFYAVVDGRDRRIRYASAGHPHAFLIGPSGHRRLPALDVPLGLASDRPFSERTVEMGDAGVLLVFTDGLFESASPPRARAEERLVKAVRELLPADPGTVVRRIFEGAERPGSRSARSGLVPDPDGGSGVDDRTAVVVGL